MSESTGLFVVVLAGGISHERDVSLRSGRRVADALARAGHRVELRDPDAGLLPFLSEARPDVVFPALHGSSGEDGTLLELLSALGVPTVGSTGPAARRAWSKPVASSIVAGAGVTVPASIVLSHESFRELGAASVLRVIREALPGALVVKPASGGSAQGVTIVEDPSDLPRAMVDAFTYADAAVVEQRIVGTEVSVGIVETDGTARALTAVEIVPSAGVYSFQARYNAGETTFFAPCRLEADAAARATEAAIAAHGALGLRDLSRVDLIVDEAGTPWFLEANVLPGLTETSLMPLAIEASGTEATTVYDALVRSAARRGA
ncbi:D-alanine--D-alanine ligase family protein [Agromyces marinus]|uniref:D-alanine--D-alanine ligase n=1 Tax=Agromyces marinus TaxID=1389020 RepID=A0ABN6YFU7_9MICO|nr:ATP-grasp domain-containing protein [Agromyces marinus]UIP60098.1 D-alanine--D-alanine ligase [Agromyces marinus]BDZ54782.1 D-alanine--D-alanine ligase [Agromyces marinus]